jgi:hypothetical protein
MTAHSAAAAQTCPLPPHLDFYAVGDSLADVLALLPGLSDAACEALPQEGRDLAALLVTLIEDEDKSTEVAAYIADAPVSLVARYRNLTGI